MLIINPDTNALDTTSIAGLGNGGTKWSGGVLANNGLIYGMPLDSQSVLIIDPEAMTVDTTIITLSSTDKWIGVVLAANGKVVGIPFHSDAVLVVDPETNTADTTSLTVAGTAISKYNSGVLAANNLIYAIPYFADNVLVIDVGC